MLSDQAVNAAGQQFAGRRPKSCLSQSFNACTNWLNSLHLRQQVSYQPASRFWPLQGIETGIYLIFAAGLGWLCTWQVRRRRA